MPRLASCRLMVFAVVILVLGFPTFARAQKDAGSIVGTVKDPTGALVRNARVTVTDVERGTNFSATTNDAGEYVAGPKQGGGYFGAKKAMRPVSVVWDYYATADPSTAHVYAVNQTAEPLRHVNVSVAFYSVDGTRKYANETKDIEVAPYSSLAAMSVARISGLSSTYFVGCRMSSRLQRSRR